jgi:hypothetical protein
MPLDSAMDPRRLDIMAIVLRSLAATLSSSASASAAGPRRLTRSTSSHESKSKLPGAMPFLPLMPALQNSTSIGSPCSFFASRAICPRFVTSRGYFAFAPRSVPITRQPSAAYWRASSLPRPRPAPVTRMVGILGRSAHSQGKPRPMSIARDAGSHASRLNSPGRAIHTR